MAAQSLLRIICVACPRVDDRLSTIEFGPDDERLTCPICDTHYRVLTREVIRGAEEPLPGGTSRYQILTREPNGRERMRVFRASPRIGFYPQELASLVYRRSRLVGIADQTRGNWWPVPRQATADPNPDRARLWRLLLAVCALLGLAQLVRLAPIFIDLVQRQPRTLVVLAVLLVLAAAPGFWVLLRNIRDARLQRQRTQFTWLDDE
jgi:hypothetical protein